MHIAASLGPLQVVRSAQILRFQELGVVQIKTRLIFLLLALPQSHEACVETQGLLAILEHLQRLRLLSHGLGHLLLLSGSGWEIKSAGLKVHESVANMKKFDLTVSLRSSLFQRAGKIHIQKFKI